MPKTIISAADLIHGSWLNFRRHWLAYLEFGVWFIVIGIASWGVDIAARTWGDTQFQVIIYSIIGNLPILLVTLAVTMILSRVIWAHLNEEEMNISGILSDTKNRFIWLLLASLAASLLILGGMLLLVIPGIILYVRYRFYSYFVIIDGKKSGESLAASAQVTAGKFWPILWRIVAISAFFVAVFSLLNTLLFALIGTAFGDVGHFFGQISYRLMISDSDMLIYGLVPQLSLAIILPLIAASEMLLWANLKKQD
jgi:hypothetical protein